MNNKISITIDPQIEQEILNKIAELNSLLPQGLIVLTEDERKGMALMGDKSSPFVEKAIDIAGQNPVLLPSYVDLDEARKDFEAYKALNRILRALNPVTSKLKDSAQLCGNEALVVGLSIYNGAKDGQHRSIPGAREAVQELSPRFPGRGAGKPKS